MIQTEEKLLSIRIGIIGAGASGMSAAKACLEQGFEVVVFEKMDYIVGLWKYKDEDIEGIASIMKSTVINTSKEMSAFSDFPPPSEFPNYMHNTKMVNELLFSYLDYTFEFCFVTVF
jgi:dimethylaniline monooxygenase (N-oxide forming)